MLVFAHITDLHFADVLANQQMNGAKFQGPHGLAYCLGLATLLDRTRAAAGMHRDDALGVVVSGDITRAGSKEEFAVAQLFLRSRSRYTRQPVLSFGLGVNEDELACVPGNHDQWQGKAGYAHFALGVPSRNPALAGAQFKPTPWHQRWAAPGQQNLGVDLFGLDSSSAFHQQKNYFQGGNISEQELADLDRLMHRVPSAKGFAKAIVCHHSISYKSWGGDREALDRASHQRLLQHARRHRVAAILTGHTHDFGFIQLDKRGGAAQQLWELRSAATTAMPAQPWLKKPAAKSELGLLLHTLRPTLQGGVEWTAQQYGWGASGFAAVAGASQRIDIT